MKLNSSQLDAFFVIAKTLNFTRAAEVLHVTQSALSQRIANLEEDLETTLFIREKKSIRLTEAGEQVLRFCQLTEGAESELLNRLKNVGSDFGGIIRMGGFSSVNRSLLIPALKGMMNKNPRLSLQIMTKELHELDGLLKSAAAEYIITSKKNDSPDIENLFLGYEEYVLVKSKKFSGLDFFLDHDENDSITKEYLGQSKVKTKFLKRRYLDDIYGLIEGVKNGYGMAVLPIHLIEDEKDLEIVDRNRVLKVPVYFQFYTQPYYRGVHFKLLEDVQRHFRQSLPQAKLT